MGERDEPFGEHRGLVAGGELVEPARRDRTRAEPGAEQRAGDGPLVSASPPKFTAHTNPSSNEVRVRSAAERPERRADVPGRGAVRGLRGLVGRRDRPIGLGSGARQLRRVDAVEKRGDRVAQP